MKGVYDRLLDDIDDGMLTLRELLDWRRTITGDPRLRHTARRTSVREDNPYAQRASGLLDEIDQIVAWMREQQAGLSVALATFTAARDAFESWPKIEGDLGAAIDKVDSDMRPCRQAFARRAAGDARVEDNELRTALLDAFELAGARHRLRAATIALARRRGGNDLTARERKLLRDVGLVKSGERALRHALADGVALQELVDANEDHAPEHVTLLMRDICRVIAPTPERWAKIDRELPTLINVFAIGRFPETQQREDRGKIGSVARPEMRSRARETKAHAALEAFAHDSPIVETLRKKTPRIRAKKAAYVAAFFALLGLATTAGALARARERRVRNQRRK